jgi:hypothetical protein
MTLSTGSRVSIGLSYGSTDQQLGEKTVHVTQGLTSSKSAEAGACSLPGDVAVTPSVSPVHKVTAAKSGKVDPKAVPLSSLEPLPVTTSAVPLSVAIAASEGDCSSSAYFSTDGGDDSGDESDCSEGTVERVEVSEKHSTRGRPGRGTTGLVRTGDCRKWKSGRWDDEEVQDIFMYTLQ